MIGRRRFVGILAVLTAVGGLCTSSSAQVPGSTQAQLSGYASPTGVNPYANPYTNPFLNPYMTQAPMDRNTALLYFLNAQQASGGLGSGRLSGVRRAPGPQDRRQPAEMPTSLGAPGGGAGRYFQRGPAGNAGRAPYFQRHNRYFANNGR